MIARVYTYSLEIKDDGKIVIWALGVSGWYALSPAKAYKPIFQQMVEKTIIWLFLEDRYTPDIFKGKHRKLKDTTDLLYKKVGTRVCVHAYTTWSDNNCPVLAGKSRIS